MSPTLAIVGASVRAAVMSALRGGLSSVAADLFADGDLRALCLATRVDRYPSGLAEWLSSAPADAWIYTGALENYPTLVDAMARSRPLLGNSGAVLRRVRSPFELVRVLDAAGLPFPETRADPTRLPRDGSWLAKNWYGSSGSGVRAFDGPGCLVAAIPTRGRGSPHTDARRPVQSRLGGDRSPLRPAATARGGSCYFQKRIDGVPGAAVFVAAHQTAQLLGITRQLVGTSWTRAAAFQYAGSLGPWPLDRPAVGQLQRLGNVLAGEFGVRGLFGVDFVLSDGQVWMVEINPRYAASVEVVERVTGVHAMGLHVEACEGQVSAALRPPLAGAVLADVWGKAILFAERDVQVSAAFNAWCCEENCDPLWPFVADIPLAGQSIPQGRPIATAFAQGESESDAIARLKQRLAALETRLYV